MRSPGITRQFRRHLRHSGRPSSADSEPDQFRSREYWVLAQQGDPACRPFRDAGLVLNVEPDEAGREVQFVTFRLDLHSLTGNSSQPRRQNLEEFLTDSV
jgi:hypothetical protein